ncbi:hypothetical protein K474DRAFT_1680717 [Panus rudis PR-1116 ss-1]|nr:hypothetical protein K474DRAFT_1680717 [Panus rudis PR-1116 ss-1]
MIFSWGSGPLFLLRGLKPRGWCGSVSAVHFNTLSFHFNVIGSLVDLILFSYTSRTSTNCTMNFSSIIFLLTCFLPFVLTAPILVTPYSSTLQARQDDIDCKQITRGDGGKFIVPKPSDGQLLNLAPVLNKCFKFTNLNNDLDILCDYPTLSTPPPVGNGTSTVIPAPTVDCNAVAQGPADDGTFTVDASSLGSKFIASFAFRIQCSDIDDDISIFWNIQIIQRSLATLARVAAPVQSESFKVYTHSGCNGDGAISSNILFFLTCVLPIALTAPIVITPPSSALQARQNVDCKQITRGDAGKFALPKGADANRAPFLNECFKFINQDG